MQVGEFCSCVCACMCVCAYVYIHKENCLLQGIDWGRDRGSKVIFFHGWNTDKGWLYSNIRFLINMKTKGFPKCVWESGPKFLFVLVEFLICTFPYSVGKTCTMAHEPSVLESFLSRHSSLGHLGLLLLRLNIRFSPDVCRAQYLWPWRQTEWEIFFSSLEMLAYMFQKHLQKPNGLAGVQINHLLMVWILIG